MVDIVFPVVDFRWIMFPGFDEQWIPTKGSPLSSGFDLYAAEYICIPRCSWAPIRHRIGIELPPPSETDGWVIEAQVRSRSGLAYKHGLQVLNSPGTVDNDYRGELITILANHGPTDYWVRAGDRISQLVVVAIPNCIELQAGVDHDKVSVTDRGTDGFGSTGR